MNVLMLGNGFDLNYGLATKYINFLNTVNFVSGKHMTNKLQQNCTVGQIFGHSVLQKTDKEIADSYQKYAEVYDSIAVDSGIVDQLKNCADNFWFRYLFKSFNKDIGWIDFEREISTVLHSFQACLPSLGVRFGVKDIPNDMIHRYVLTTFNFFYEKKSDAGISSTGRAVDSEYSVKKEFMLEYPLGSKNRVINKEKIIETLERALLELAEGLQVYLQCFVENVVVELCKQGLVKPMAALTNAKHIVTFNYTNTYEQIYRNGQVFHIHGKLQDRIILGVNPDDSDTLEHIDTLFLPFKKYYQRVINRSDAEYIEWVSQKNSNVSLVVMGHSLDSTDKDIIMQMFDLAKDITVLYYSESVEASLVSNLVKIYGKEQFDELRMKKRLRFLPQNAHYDGFAEDREKKEQEAMIRALNNWR